MARRSAGLEDKLVEPKKYLMTVIFEFYNLETMKDEIRTRSSLLSDLTSANINAARAMTVYMEDHLEDGKIIHYIPARRIVQVTIQEVYAEETSLSTQ